MPTPVADLTARIASRRRIEDIAIEGLGEFRLRALSAGDAVAFQSAVKRGASEDELVFTLLARSLVDGQNQPLFPDVNGEPNPDGIAFTKSLDPNDYKALAIKLGALNGVSDQDIEGAGKN